MRLCEEYLTRHAIKVPLVRHVQEASIFYRSHNFWQVLYIRWRPPEIHPGHYLMLTYQPIHNGIDRGQFFLLVREVKVQWDEYEAYFLNWVDSAAVETVASHEVSIAAWEMFLHCCDKRLARHIRCDQLAMSIDPEKDTKIRMQQILACEDYFKKYDSEMLHIWREGEIARFSKCHAPWFASMMSGL